MTSPVTPPAQTLESSLLLVERHGLALHDVLATAARFRGPDGVRLTNCQDNTGKPHYAFNAVQVQFLPEELRPPHGTAGQVAS